MRGEYVEYCVNTFGFPDGDVSVDGEVEGGGAPEGAPPLGEDGCPQGRLGGESGDDDVQHLVGEVVDEVEACQRLVGIWFDQPSVVGRLGLHLN